MAILFVAEHVDVVCLQETHLKANEERYLREVYKGLIYHAPVTTRSKGVMLGISKRLPWELIEADIDSKGRFIILNGLLGRKGLIIVGVCAWNTGQLKLNKAPRLDGLVVEFYKKNFKSNWPLNYL